MADPLHLDNHVPGLSQLLADTNAAVAAEFAAVDAAIAGLGGATSYELDFGSVPTPDKMFTITDASVSAASKITVSPNGNPATGRVGNDYAWDIINFSAVPATGTFDVYASVVNGSVVGKRNIYYSVGA